MEWTELIRLGVRIAFLILSFVASTYLIPWLKEKHLYNIVNKMVLAAEKWARTHDIDKKAWVIERLKARGITVNEYVDALIEACVEQLDIAIGTAIDFDAPVYELAAGAAEEEDNADE